MLSKITRHSTAQTKHASLSEHDLERLYLGAASLEEREEIAKELTRRARIALEERIRGLELQQAKVRSRRRLGLQARDEVPGKAAPRGDQFSYLWVVCGCAVMILIIVMLGYY